MRFLFSKQGIMAMLAVVVLGGGWLVLSVGKGTASVPVVVPVPTSTGAERKVIGQSVEGCPIEAYTYGTGKKHLLFIGGMHGGYEWNSVLLSYTFKNYLDSNPDVISKDLTVTVIPSINPDGVYKVTGKEGRFTSTDVSTDKAVLASGRFNAHEVDLNRNFDCKWQPKSTWQQKTVSAGSAPFSEPESEALRAFVVDQKPDAVIFWHSQANAVYASECEQGILPVTLDLMNVYSKASGYTAVKSFDSYAITGDAEGWLASVGIPAITVELKTHEAIEWEKNLKGILAVLEYYAN